MGAEGGSIVAGRTLNEPCLLGLSKDRVFNFTSGVISIIDLEGFVYRGIGEDHKGFSIGVFDLVGVFYDHDSVDRVGGELRTVFMTPTAFFPIKAGRDKTHN